MANYIVLLKDGFNSSAEKLDQSVADIKALAKTEGEAVEVTNVFAALGTLTLTCNEAFAQKLEKLPCVSQVEAERRFRL